tara:strand:- start:1147 stop:2115 length:969 start_codon:yes stop_codon:yes gene_type:complete
MRRLIIIGGGYLTIETAKLFKKKFDVVVITSLRHSNEIINNKKFKDYFKNVGIEFHIKSKLSSKFLISNFKKNSILISIGSHWIIKNDVIKYFKGKTYNVHGTRLPQDRGGGGFSWQIMQEKNIGYAVIHEINDKIDDGDIIFYKEFNYPENSIPLERNNIYISKTLQLIKENMNFFLKDLQVKKLNQTPFFSIYWPRLNSFKQGWIDWKWGGRYINSFIKAFDDPYPGAKTMLNNNIICLKKSLFENIDGSFHPFQSGIIYRKTNKNLFVSVTDGTLKISSIFNEKGKELNIKKIKLGDRFFTPQKKLEKAMSVRAKYSSK